jgi:aminoglycoside phosphotransferase (APT) family kinase protein
VRDPGPLIASGRDCDIYDYGPGLVLRRARDGRSMANEARIMEYARERGYPVPAVEELSHDGSDLVMERIEGRSMLAIASHRPWTIRQQGAVLADLHNRLHEIEAPDFVRPSPVGAGDRLIHLDLHPLNVIISAKGPVVIDWPNAASGDAAVDIGVAWLLLAAAEIPAGRLMASALGFGRSLLINRFLASFELTSVKAQLRAVMEWKIRDANILPDEQLAMRRLVAAVEAEA